MPSTELRVGVTLDGRPECRDPTSQPLSLICFTPSLGSWHVSLPVR